MRTAVRTSPASGRSCIATVTGRPDLLRCLREQPTHEGSRVRFASNMCAAQVHESGSSPAHFSSPDTDIRT